VSDFDGTAAAVARLMVTEYYVLNNEHTHSSSFRNKNGHFCTRKADFADQKTNHLTPGQYSME
jgi:hypothetical protein